tara:strand:+ start:2978 stop:3370 length:393 start_codon:yes stop_codon:yes gene_type:complete
MNEADCTECQDTGTMYMCDDCWGPCIHCDVHDKNKTIEEVRKERDNYYEQLKKTEEELDKLKEEIAKISLLANPPREPYIPLTQRRVEGSHVDRPGDINEDGAKLCDTCREEVHWSDDGQTELCPCDSKT